MPVTAPPRPPDADPEALIEEARRRARRRRFIGAAGTLAVLLGAIAAYLGIEQTGGSGVGERGDRTPAAAKRPRSTVRHIVTRSRGTDLRINLATGQARPIVVTSEIWAEDVPGKASGRMLTDGRVEGRLISREQTLYCTRYRQPVSSPRGGCRTTLSPLGTSKEYRQLLKQGLLREVGRGTLRGRRVVWLVKTKKSSQYRMFGQRIALDAQSYMPVLVKNFFFGRFDSETELVRMDAVPRGRVKFGLRARLIYPPPPRRTGMVVRTVELPGLGQARRVLGRRPLWLGPRFSGHRLAFVGLARWRIDPDPFAAVRARRFLSRPFVRVRYRGRPANAFVRIDQVVGGRAAVQMLGRVAPPDGYVDVWGSGRRSGSRWDVTFGLLRSHGIFVQLRSPNRAAVIAAAKALRPIPVHY